MCDFVSWIEFDVGKKKEIMFLTYNDIYHTKRGQELRDYTKSDDDLIGHGAIRWYYSVNGGEDKECCDLSSPDNFPPKISKAIKKGEFIGLPEFENLGNILTKVAEAEYLKARNSAWAEYQKVRNSAWAEYQKVRQALFKKIFMQKKNRIKDWQ